MRKLLLVVCLASLGWAQESGPDPLAEKFVPPEVIMRNQKALEITDSQREQIKQQVSEAQTQFTGLQWDLQAEVEKLSDLLSDHNVDKRSAVNQLDKVLSVEADIKRSQLAMLLALRGVLTPEQFQEAQEIKRKSRPVPSPWYEEARRQFEKLQQWQQQRRDKQ